MILAHVITYPYISGVRRSLFFDLFLAEFLSFNNVFVIEYTQLCSLCLVNSMWYKSGTT